MSECVWPSESGQTPPDARLWRNTVRKRYVDSTHWIVINDIGKFFICTSERVTCHREGKPLPFHFISNCPVFPSPISSVACDSPDNQSTANLHTTMTQHVDKPITASPPSASDLPPALSPSSGSESASLSYAFFILGIGSLLPYNALLSVLDFYNLKFPSDPIAHYITNAYSFPFMASGALLTVYPPPSNLRTPLILLSYFLMTLISLLYPLLSRFHSLAVPLVLTALLGAINALDQSVLFGILALLLGNHPSCTTAYTAGGAAASILLVSLRIGTRLVLDIDPGQGHHQTITPESLRPGFILFFIVCTLLCAYCTVVVIWMYTKSEVYAGQVLVAETDGVDSGDISTSPLNSDTTSNETSNTTTPLLNFTENMRHLFFKLRLDIFSMFFCFVLTLMLFPGITTELPVTLRLNASSKTSSWFPLVIVAAFALGDLLGRISWSGTYATFYPNSLPYSSLARALFIPVVVILWCRTKGTSVLVAAATVFAIGMTNGFVMNAGFLIAPRRLNTSSEKEAAGRLMFLANNWGLFAGSSCGAILQLVLSHYTSFR